MKNKEKLKIISNIKKNIIKLRCFEMILILNEVERIKNTVTKANYFFFENNPLITQNEIKNLNGMKKFEFILNRLVSLGLFKERDRQEVVDFIDFRNDIGHRTNHLFLDLVDDLDFRSHKIYKNNTLIKITETQKKLEKVLSNYVIFCIDLDNAIASPILEQVNIEIEIIKKRINKYIDKFNEI